MGKSFFFFGQAFSGNGKDRHITVGEGWRVDGGTKEDHDHMVDVTQETSKEFEKNKPQTIEEAAQILGDVVKKVGKPERFR